MSYPKTFRSLISLAAIGLSLGMPSSHYTNLVASPYKPSVEPTPTPEDLRRIELAKQKRERKAKQKASRL
jgi:hypothetical protein